MITLIIEGGRPHDAQPAQRGHGARPAAVRRVLREPAVQVGRPQTLPDAGHQGHWLVRAVADGHVQV